MNILVIGGGGREHALAWKCRQSPLVAKLYVAPGNAGTENEQGINNIDIGAEDIPELIRFAKRNDIGLTIVGPEAPLVMGIVDAFEFVGLSCFGPSRDASQLEGSKTFTKAFLSRHFIPTAAYDSFTNIDAALKYLEGREFPQVIKADGLAAGKGVIIAQTRDQAEQAVTDMLGANRFGEAGHRVVIEDFLDGEEVSFICMVDGENILSMASSQDHKKAYNGDIGPNTGGMGAYSPAPILDARLHDLVIEKIIRPTVSGLASEGMPYIGFLYAGLVVDGDGLPKVLEYNCRFGDPETQPIMVRLQSDLVAHCLAALRGELGQEVAQWDSRPSLGVVMAAEGYPESYKKGHVIQGLDQVFQADTKVFHAGTRMLDNQVVTSGGRVLCVTSLGEDIAQAQSNAYAAVRKIHWEGGWYRNDIGYRAIERENS